MCGHIEFAAAPEKCPACGAPKSAFGEDPDALMPAEKEGKEKHVPEILVTKECGLIPGECRDIHARVGSTLHPMMEDHWIQWIDLYFDKQFAARYTLHPQSLLPAVGLHVKKDVAGTITVIEHCNKHGSWMAEAAL
jgi:superoxide reductase